MKRRKLSMRMILLVGLFFLTAKAFSQDPNFYIYLCIGQSNMEGQGAIEAQDKIVDSRFQVMEAVDCSNLGRKKGTWYTAVPPLCRCNTGLSPADYFGKTMVATLPDSIRVGVVNISIAGCKIELYDKDNYQTYSATVESWMKSIITAYSENPYAHLLEVAKLAQKDGVIKGILLHQGESNTGDSEWTKKVKGVYDNLIKDLGLKADSVPLLAGEVVNADQGGVCASMNSIIATLPKTIPNSYVIPSNGCYDAADNLHFSSLGYRKLGRRYAVKMLSLLGYEITEPKDSLDPVGTESFYFEPECETVGADWDKLADGAASNGNYVMIKSEKESATTAPATSDGEITISFTAAKDSTYYIFGRLNCPTANDDSYWVKIDNGEYVMANGLTTSGWQWAQIASYAITKGGHSFTIAGRENGAKLDKICISSFAIAPSGMGLAAKTLCKIEAPVGVSDNEISKISIFPNPANSEIHVSCVNSFVLLEIYSITGEKLIQKSFGNSIKETSLPINLSSGIYILKLIDESNRTGLQKLIVD